MAKRLTNAYIDNYKKDNYEDSHVCSYEDPAVNVKSVFYDDLPNTEINAFPVACDLVDKDGTVVHAGDLYNYSLDSLKKMRLRYHYLPYFHEIYIGTTGSGKTTGCIEPQIRALGKQKNQPNLFITDPKGELFSHHSRFLKEQGYQIYIINFKDVYHSHYLNFLEEPFDEYQKLSGLKTLVSKATLKEGRPDPKHLELRAPEGAFNGETYISAGGLAFPGANELENYIKSEEFNIKARVSSLISDIAQDLIPVTEDKDRTWADGARGLLIGIMSLLLNCSIKDPSFKKEYFNLKTINDTFTLFLQGCLVEDQIQQGYRSNASKPQYQMMKDILEYMKGDDRHYIDNVITTASVTRRGFMSTFESQMAKWMQAHIFQITSFTNIDINNDEEKPWAIFFASRDYSKGDFDVASAFIDYVYRAVLLKADRAPKDENNDPKTRTVHFLLDEFGNIPPIPSFQIKISTARSRKIFFHLFLQSYQQLESVYGQKNARIIVDNCNQELFIGSQNFETKKAFAEKCGKHAVESLSSVISSNKYYQFEQESVVQMSDLEELKPGELYVKRYGYPILKTSFIRSYMLANYGFFKNFNDDKAFEEIAPTNYRGLEIDKISYARVIYYEDKGLNIRIPERLKKPTKEVPVYEEKKEEKAAPKKSRTEMNFRSLLEGDDEDDD